MRVCGEVMVVATIQTVIILTLLITDYVVDLGPVPVCRCRVPVMHVVLQRKCTESVTLVLLARYLRLEQCRGWCGL